MALTVGELNAYLRLNDSEFVRVLDADGRRLQRFRRQVDIELRAIERAFSSLRPVITPEIDTAHLHAELDEIERRADRLSTLDPTIHVHVDSTRASSEIERMERSSRHLGDDDGGGRAASGYARLASTVGSALGPLAGVTGEIGLMAAKLGAAVPVAAGLAAALVNIAPAASVAATGVFALAQAVSVIKIGTSGVGSAFAAAFAPAISGGGGAAGAANQAAKALQAVKDATKQAAQANAQAAREVKDAERSVADAQKDARAAQKDLNASRVEATRDLQDMNESLDDAYLDQRQAVLDVQDAQQELDAVKAKGAAASAQDLAAAQLAYDRAQQRLEEQTITTKRLKTDTDAANKAGVDGSKTMVDARAKVSDANRTVGDQERALSDARRQQAETAQQGLDAIRKAQEAMAQSAGGASGGVNQLAAALAALSPNARAFVVQAIALKGAWDKVKLAVQDRLFAGLAGELKSTAGVLLPILQKNLVSSAGALNAMAKNAAGAARQIGRDGTLGKAMASASGGLMNLSGLPGIFLKALTQVAAAAGPTFLRLTSAMGRGAAQVGSALDKAFKSGAMERAINVAVGLLKELGQIAGNVFSILGSVMGAAQVSGGGFLGVVKQISGALAGAFKSDAVQSGLKALFQTMAVLGRTVAPLLVQALGLIAPVLTALAPPAQRLITALGGALQPILTALGPVLLAAAGAVGSLVNAVVPLLPVIGHMIAALGPILTPILKIVGELFASLAPVLAELGRSLLPPLLTITRTLGTAFKALMPVLATTLRQLGGGQGLTAIVKSLGSVIGQMVTQYAVVWLNMFKQLLPVIPVLIPVVLQLAQSLAQILTALAPLLPQITMLSAQLITQLLPAILPLIPLWAAMEVALLRLTTGVISKVVIPVFGAMIAVFRGLQHAMQPAITAVKWLTTSIAAAFRWLYDVLLGHSIIPDIINGTVRWFASLPAKAWNALSGLGGNLYRRAADAGNRMVGAVRTAIGAAVSWIRDLPGRASDALGNLRGVLYNSGQALLRGFVDGIKSMGNVVSNAVSSIVSSAKDFFPNSPAKRGPFSGSGWTLYSGMAVGNDWAAGLSSRAGVMGAAAQAVMASAHAGLAMPDTPLGALVAPPPRPWYGSGYAGGGAPSGGASSGTQRIVLEFRAQGDPFMRALRESIRTAHGGAPNSVQLALGQNG